MTKASPDLPLRAIKTSSKVQKIAARVAASTPKKSSRRARRLPKKTGLKAMPPAEALVRLKEHYPDAHCALDHRNAFELLIATILSAQCTDERVNKVTPELFRRFPTAAKMAAASSGEIEKLIFSTGFYKAKTKNIQACCAMLVAKFNGLVPRRMEDLIQLGGVGRKTANVVLGNAYDIASGIVVDTHVTRLSFRLGWSLGCSAESIEKQLVPQFAKVDWILLPHLLIFHGRAICKARSPQCEVCFLFDGCPRHGV